jgi:hypothetical protein
MECKIHLRITLKFVTLLLFKEQQEVPMQLA